MAAYTRIDDRPILERGLIANPDVVVLADETLLEDPTAGVLAGAESASALFINTARGDAAARELKTSATVVTYDLTRLTMETLGVAVALSAGLASAAAKIVGSIDEETLLAALREEFGAMGLSAEQIGRNETIARAVYAAAPTVSIAGRAVSAPLSDEAAVVSTAYEGVAAGTPSVLQPGNAELRRTGAWRVERPIIDLDVCTRCGLCYVMCPDAAIQLDREGRPVIDYEHCKGCMICRELCPLKAISTQKETQAW